MSLNTICLRIGEDASGANGQERLDRYDRIWSASAALIDWVYESLIAEGIELDDAEFNAVRQLVARAMITQHDFDVELAAS